MRILTTLALASHNILAKLNTIHLGTNPNTDITALNHQRIVAIGDWHGDYKNVIATLTMAELLNDNHDWAGGDTIFIQTGDIVDRGDDTILLFKLIQKLTKQAKIDGGLVVQILGNHEVFNIMGVMNYVTPGDIESFGGIEERKKAWSKDGWIGKYVRRLGLTVRVNRTVFFHGGASPLWSQYGLKALQKLTTDAINQMSRKELSQSSFFRPATISPYEYSPLWFRQYSDDSLSVKKRCDLLDIALRDLDADRMVVGHTVTKSGKILSRCNNKFHVIDVGISKVYGGYSAALEIVGNRVTAIYPYGREVIQE